MAAKTPNGKQTGRTLMVLNWRTSRIKKLEADLQKARDKIREKPSEEIQPKHFKSSKHVYNTLFQLLHEQRLHGNTTGVKGLRYTYGKQTFEVLL